MTVLHPIAAFLRSLARAPQLAEELDRARADAAYWRAEYLRAAGDGPRREADRPTEPLEPVDARDHVRRYGW